MTTTRNFLNNIFSNNKLDDEFVSKNFSELLRFVDYYEIPLQFFNCIDQKYDVENIYDNILNENIVVVDRFEHELYKISNIFKENSIPHSVLVGIPFSNHYFNNKYYRLQDDLDFFVSLNNSEQIYTIMKSIGYLPIGKSPSKNRKHQSFINQGFGIKDKLISGRSLVKIYFSLSEDKYFKTTFEDFQDSIITYDNLPVFNEISTLIHLIIHAHLYDLHLKILYDIYVFCKNTSINWTEFWNMSTKLNTSFTSAICLSIMRNLFLLDNIEIPDNLITNDVLNYSNKFSSEEWWINIFPKMTPDELTYIRAFLSGHENYSNIYSEDINNNLCRRVGIEVNSFKIIK